jgi:hypothetical protein
VKRTFLGVVSVTKSDFKYSFLHGHPLQASSVVRLAQETRKAYGLISIKRYTVWCLPFDCGSTNL